MAGGFSSGFSAGFGGTPTALSYLVTEGFGNGVFTGTIPLVVTIGYLIGEAAVYDPLGFLVALPPRTFQAELRHRTLSTFLPDRTFTVTLKPGGRETP